MPIILRGLFYHTKWEVNMYFRLMNYKYVLIALMALLLWRKGDLTPEVKALGRGMGQVSESLGH